METPIWLKHGLRVVAASICVTVAGWYSPILAAVGWRVFHPTGWAEYQGLHIRVPWLWICDADAVKDDNATFPQGVSLRKETRSFAKRGPAQTIFITVLSPEAGVPPDKQTEEWIEGFRTAHPGAEFDGKTPVELPRGASCLSAREPDQARIVWTCISVQGGWVANFEGMTTDTPVFFQILAGLKR